jgi:ubiquinone/menaquinone biosynthesis C-methylase UbiE
MDTLHEVLEYESMDHREVNQRFVDDLLGGGPVGRRVIDLGCGPAAIAIELCERAEEVEVMGIDSSIEMLELAKREIDFAGMLDRIFLEHADVKSMDDFDHALADTVVSNSLLHHLAEPAVALRTAIRLVRPGGRIFFRDLFRPPATDDVERLVETHCKQESEFAQQLFRQSLRAALTLEEIRQVCRGLGFHDDDVQMTSDRHWTIDWTRPIDAGESSAPE